MPNLSPTCQKIQNQINSLEVEKKSLQAELDDTPGKSALVKQINALTAQINAKKKELAECIKKNPYVPPKNDPCSNKCADAKAKLDKARAALRKEIQAALAPLQAELQEADPGMKTAIIKEINKTREEISKNSPNAKKVADAQKAYYKCILDCGGKLPLNATFQGTVSVETSNADAAGPFSESLNIGILFSAFDHAGIGIISFPPIVIGPYEIPGGTMTTTVSLIGGGGTFNPKTKMITLSLSLYFNHSSGIAGDSPHDIQLTTTTALNKDGDIGLKGNADFQEGYLDGDNCEMTVDGTISPLP